MEKKRLMINLLVRMVSFVIHLLISFGLSRYVVEKIGADAYGFVSLANDFTGYAEILTVALNSMASRFITVSIHREDYESADKYFTSVIFSNIFLALALTVPFTLIVLFLDRIVNVSNDLLFDVRILWTFIFLNFLVTIVGSVFGVVYFAKNRLDLESMNEIKANLLRMCLLLLFYIIFRPSVMYIGMISLICTLFLLYKNYRYSQKLLGQLKIRREYFDVHYVREILSSGIWNSFTRLGSVLSNGLDLLITNLLISAQAMGLVSVAKTLPTKILSVFAIFSGIFAPDLTKSFAQDDMGKMKEQLIFAIKFLGMVSSIPLVFLYVYGDVFYSLWMPSLDPALMQRLSVCASAAFAVNLPLEPLWNVFTAANKVKVSSIYLFVNSILTVIVVFLLLQLTENDLIRMYIIICVSVGFSIIRGFFFLPLYGAYCMKIGYGSFYPVIFKNLFAIGAGTLVFRLVKLAYTPRSWGGLFVTVCFMSVCLLAMNYYLILSRADREKTVVLVRGKFKKIMGGL